ncbi:MAG: hypothetical protein ACLFTT_10590 [Candidatus Hydrogenedentota bacterium]
MKAWSLRLVRAATVILSATLLSGCPELSFQILFENDGEFPVTELYIEAGAVSEDAVNVLSEPVQPGTELLLDRIFARGPVYEAIAVFVVDGEHVELPQTIETAGLGDGFITYTVGYSAEGNWGTGYWWGRD